MASNVVFVPNIRAQQMAFREWPGMVGQHIRKITVRGAALASLEAPAPGRPPRNRTGINYATGELAMSIVPAFGRRGKELEGQIIAVPKHAIFVHAGTVPHMILPRRHTYLKFYWRKIGKTVYARGVKHPGSAANEFLVRGVKKAL